MSIILRWLFIWYTVRNRNDVIYI